MGWVARCGGAWWLAMVVLAASPVAAQSDPSEEGAPADAAPAEEPPEAAAGAEEAELASAASEVASDAPEAPVDTSPAHQERGDRVGVPPPTTDVTTPAGYAAPGPDPIWELYHRAALALADDDEEEAIELLLRIRETPEHPAAVQAGRMLERLGVEEDRPTRSGERRSGIARAELIGFQTLMGAGTGSLLCGFGCDGPRAWVVANLLGFSAGLGLSVGLSGRGVTYGQSNLYNSAHRWGLLNGFLLFATLGISFERDPSFGGPDFRPNALVASLLVGQALGIGAAAAVDFLIGPTGGDVALVDSLMLLSGAAISLFVPAIADGFSARGARAWMGALLIGNAGTMALGAHLATKHDPSRARALLLDVGMGAGIGIAVGLAAAFQRSSIDGRILLGAGSAGSLAGFVAAWFLTRNFDRSPSDDDELSHIRFGVGPTQGGAVGNLHVAF